MGSLMRKVILGRQCLNALPKLKDNILEALKKVIANILKQTLFIQWKIHLVIWTWCEKQVFSPESGDFILKIVLHFSSSTALICRHVFVFWSLGKCSKRGEATKVDRWCVPGSFGVDLLRYEIQWRLNTAEVDDKLVKPLTGLSSTFVKTIRQFWGAVETQNTHFFFVEISVKKNSWN